MTEPSLFLRRSFVHRPFVYGLGRKEQLEGWKELKCVRAPIFGHSFLELRRPPPLSKFISSQPPKPRHIFHIPYKALISITRTPPFSVIALSVNRVSWTCQDSPSAPKHPIRLLPLLLLVLVSLSSFNIAADADALMTTPAPPPRPDAVDDVRRQGCPLVF